MSHDEWKKQKSILQCKITKARNKAKMAIQLAVKLDHLNEAKRNEFLLRKHKLNYFELVNE